MSFEVYLFNLIVSWLQEIGIILGVGAETIVLVAYIMATRDGVVDQKEEQFGRAVQRVLSVGLWLVLISGIGAVLFHLYANSVGDELYGHLEQNLLAPTFLFKWVLILGLLAASLLVRRPYPHYLWEGFIGSQWYALLIVHVLHFYAAWLDIAVVYVLWSAGFMLAWAALTHGTRLKIPEQPQPYIQKPVIAAMPPPIAKPMPPPVLEMKVVPPSQPIAKPIPPPVPVAKPTPLPPPPLPKPLAPKPILIPEPVIKPIVTMTAPHKPEELPPALPHKPIPEKPPEKPVMEQITDPDQNPGLPAIRVMPRTPEDVDTQMRASVVQF
jgi:hypothetical protein